MFKNIIISIIFGINFLIFSLLDYDNSIDDNLYDILFTNAPYMIDEIENIVYDTDIEEIFEVDPVKEYEEKLEYIENIVDKKEKLIEYQKLICEYRYFIEFPIQIYDLYSEEELYAIFSTVETEVHECGFNEKCNIASVIFNRLESKKWGDTLQEVCYSKNQFSNWRTVISEDTVLACEYVFFFGDTAQGCLYFQSSGYSKYFCGAEYVFQDNAIHYFYR